MRVVAYIPPAPRRETATWHRRLSIQADVEGFQVTHVTADPAEARRLVETGMVDRVAFAQREHVEQVYPIVVPAIPHPRRRRGPAVFGGLLPAGWAVEWARRHPARAGGAVATAAAAVVAAALLLPALGGEDDPASLAEPPWVQPTASTVAPATPDAPEPTPAAPTPSPGPTAAPADPEPPASTPNIGAGSPEAGDTGAGGEVPAPAPPPAPQTEPESPPPPPPAPAPPAEPEPGPTQDDENGALCVRVGLPLVDADLCVL